MIQQFKQPSRVLRSESMRSFKYWKCNIRNLDFNMEMYVKAWST